MYHFELKPFRREWDKEVEKMFEGFSRPEATFAPACEIKDEEKAFMISLDIPGMCQEDIDIEVKDNHLYISGERKYETQTEKKKVLRTEKRYGKFSRVFSLPQNVDAESIVAAFEQGVLEVTIPKQEKSQTKKITISGRKNEAIQADLKN